MPAVSVVMPVLNEERHLRTAVRHVLEQDYPGEIELVLALGPSKDRTDAIAAELASADARIRTVRNPSGRTPAGLNAGIAAASHDVVVRVDGHGMLGPGYIATAVELLQATGADNVGGVMAAEGETAFQQAVARAMTTWLGVGGARFHTGGQAGPADTVYLGVFRRATLERLGGYDESFQRAQDWELNHRIREAGGLVWFSPELRVSYRPRADVEALARQYFHYGRWRRVVMRRHSGTASPRYLAAPAVLVAVSAGTVVGILVHPVGFALPLGYAAALVGGAALTGRGLPPRALALLPVVYATMHLAWGAGFLTSPRSLVPPRWEPYPRRTGAAGSAAPGGA
ncbi:glycosyltransferase involved in cell wall biosynthesis [Motilibacter peucedani]|uniref:4,4'-diaponeurosporenoate glycosyltransferase n=1 Tax=Motilibacter peucedani TaxID=598650 RepID=A0A420XM45_9ACTN|nr:glycosyltransferase involved in cell wall biosynthesis [Motilibacter peucedani]